MEPCLSKCLLDKDIRLDEKYKYFNLKLDD